MTTIFTPPPGGSENETAHESASHHPGGAHGGVDNNHPAQVIVDGLLCSIIKALSKATSERELIDAIEHTMTEIEIKESWWKLFNFYSDAWDDGRKMLVKDIKRQSNKLMIEDIVKQLKKKDVNSDLDMFVLPWFYTMKKFETDSEKMSNEWVKETAKDNEDRFNALENRIEKKHNDLVNQLHEWSTSIVKLMKPSYSNAASGQNVSRNVPVILPGPGIFPATHGLGNQVPRGGRLSVPAADGQTRQRLGSSAKRPRVDENDVEEVVVTETNGEDKRQTNKRKAAAVVGTSNSSVSGRKMRSPPADIFVWGVHPDTTLEDIVNDLADSDIKIETKDILVKSKTEATLKSYKISVPAADLQKALSPEIWPMRVKVREYIYYSNRSKQANPQQRREQHGQPGQHHQHKHAHVEREASGAVGVETSNRYEPLNLVMPGATGGPAL